MNHVYSITINVGREKVVVSLLENAIEIGRTEWPDATQLSEELLPAIDRMLVRCAIEPKMLSKVSVTGDLPEQYTGRRIAETVAKTIELGNDLAASQPDA